MKKIKFVLTPISLLFAMIFSFQPVMAQLINDQKTVLPDSYDPIVAALDSLVSQNYIQRLGSSAAYSYTNAGQKSLDVPTYSGDVYQKRMEKIQTPIPLCYNNQVKEYIDLYAVKRRSTMQRVMGLSGFYFPMYEQILDQQGLPLEFKYLSIVESALNPMATSRMGATGLWQFMLATGKLYNLKVNSFIDERRDPEKSTYAACQYFKDMFAIYNDWLLVIAAYNCGAGNVNRAIARSGGKHTFWEIAQYLPRETRGYVPAFIAVTYLMSFPAEHNLTAIPPLLSYFESDTVMVDQKVSLKSIADATNTPIELLQYLNPIYKKGFVPNADEPMKVTLPANKINTYLANLSSIFKPEGESEITNLASNNNFSDDNVVSERVRKIHKVKRGEHLQSIANRYECSVGDLKKWNHLRSTHLSTGQRLTVYIQEKTNAPKLAAKTETKPVLKSTSDSVLASSIAETSTAKMAAKENEGEGKFIYHTVAPGDTLWKIAQRYNGLTVEQIKEINKLQSNDIKVGSRIKVMVQG